MKHDSAAPIPSSSHPHGETQPEENSFVIRDFFAMSLGFWRGKGGLFAWLLTALMLFSLLLQVGAQVGMNTWSRFFFDALESKNMTKFWEAIAWLPILVVLLAVGISSVTISRMVFQVKWREWVTNHLVGWWIADQRYYRLGFIAPDQSAPEYRIADDVRLSIEPLVEFVIGLTSAFITAITFAGILWSVAGSISFTLWKTHITIPAYMAVGAVTYAAIASISAYIVGKPLVRRVSHKNEMEARFRAEMTRLRENAESIALIRGDADELTSTRSSYQHVVQAWFAIIRQQGVIATVLNTNSALFPIIPLLLVTPKYLSGSLTLGAVMQVVAAFSAVQGALVWFVDNIVRLAEWYASASRVHELTDALRDLDVGTIVGPETHIQFDVSEDTSIHLENLSIAERAGRVVINDASITIHPGEKVIVTGESGAGKSTLIRALAGLWPWGSGTIKIPKDARIAFVPQKPYLPLGNLRQVLLYPVENAEVTEDGIHSAMQRCSLGHLIKQLDDPDIRWDQILSGGERQRVAFCRLLLQKPQIIVMDEATSALDETSQLSLLTLLHEDLSYATVISVAHRPGVEEFHDRKLSLEKRNVGAHLTSLRLPRTLWSLLKTPA